MHCAVSLPVADIVLQVVDLWCFIPLRGYAVQRRAAGGAAVVIVLLSQICVAAPALNTWQQVLLIHAHRVDQVEVLPPVSVRPLLYYDSMRHAELLSATMP